MGYKFRMGYGFGQLGKRNKDCQKIFRKVYPTRETLMVEVVGGDGKKGFWG